MGKNLIQQRRGKGTITYRAPSFRYKGRATYGDYKNKATDGTITDFIHCSGHSAPLMEVRFSDGREVLLQAPEGVKVGDNVVNGEETDIKTGNTLCLKNIPEGTLIYNIESCPGDGGKFVRSSGVCAKILAKLSDRVSVMLPSKKEKDFHPDCRATIGIIAGSGRLEKPFLKAGFKHFAMRARNRMWPMSSGVAMNSVCHPFGGSSTNSKGHATTISRDAPPGKKVGKIAARRTGRKGK